MRDERFTDAYDTESLCKCGHTVAQHNSDMKTVRNDPFEYKDVPCCCTVCPDCPTTTKCFELAV